MARYNELARKKKDLDFGKHPDRLTTLEKPTFYASKMQVRYMVILGGLKINDKLQVLDTQFERHPRTVCGREYLRQFLRRKPVSDHHTGAHPQPGLDFRSPGGAERRRRKMEWKIKSCWLTVAAASKGSNSDIMRFRDIAEIVENCFC